jgi:hypothetical protein
VDKFTFGGIIVENVKGKKNKLFRTLYEDDDGIFVTKHTYHYNDIGDGGDLKFDYKYYIRYTDMRCTGENKYEDTPYYIEVGIVPTPRSLNNEIKQRVKDNCDCVELFDLISYGLTIRFVDDNNLFCEEALDDGLDGVATIVSSALDFLFGFQMDKYQNGIGETGWDKIREWVKKSRV